MKFSSRDLYFFDAAFTKEKNCILIGIDEVGRGPLAGPVTAVAVLLDSTKPIEGLNDSKKLSAQKRDVLFDQIKEKALEYAVAHASPEEIDQINILQASLLAMKRAAEQITTQWSLALIDGNREIESLAKKQHTVVGGDSKSASIAAASILAKVTRDRIMEKYHIEYPHYGFKSHKGYPTKLHRQVVIEKGICPIHRKSFCESLLMKNELPLAG